MKIHKGCYRIFLKLGPIGIKIAYLDFKKSNMMAAFFASITMNILEYKRYRYYTLMKPVKQWGNIWTHRGDPIPLNPTYFSCGLFNIVKTAEVLDKTKTYQFQYENEIITINPHEEDDLTPIDELNSYFNYFAECTPSNIGINNGKLVALDYGDFNIRGFNHLNVNDIDYA